MAHPDLIVLDRDLLAEQARLAGRNRRWLAERGIRALNLVSSPGAGKTTLLERTLVEVSRPTAVIEGDCATSRDAARIRELGRPVVQVNTGRGCHLDAHMVAHALEELEPAPGSLLFVENVGNLVCPAMFDLGEAAKVVLFSVTEGEDKPLKYPHLFRASRLVLVSKIDLLPHLDFDLTAAVANAREVNPELTVLPLSARTGQGMDAWYAWLETGAGK